MPYKIGSLLLVSPLSYPGLATLASLLFLDHCPASGPLHVLFLLLGKPQVSLLQFLQISAHM